MHEILILSCVCKSRHLLFLYYKIAEVSILFIHSELETRAVRHCCDLGTKMNNTYRIL